MFEQRKMCDAVGTMNLTPQSSWMAPILPPDRFEPLEVCLHDETVKRGVWTGAKWWAEGREVTPKAWRSIEMRELLIAI